MYVVPPDRSQAQPSARCHRHGAAPGQSACHVSVRKPGPSDWAVERRDG